MTGGELITEFWPQILGIVIVIAMFVKLKSGVAELRKDVDDINKRDTYVQVVRLQAQVQELEKKVEMLFKLYNENK
tara:strand:+ start:373 stop:600 length:228 start_codon:yes stop_codon:yes gene_type:complete